MRFAPANDLPTLPGGQLHDVSHSVRRNLVRHLLAATGEVETVQTIPGQNLDRSNPYLIVDQATIRKAYELALY